MDREFLHNNYYLLSADALKFAANNYDFLKDTCSNVELKFFIMMMQDFLSKRALAAACDECIRKMEKTEQMMEMLNERLRR